jgi:hypothetical protein
MLNQTAYNPDVGFRILIQYLPLDPTGSGFSTRASRRKQKNEADGAFILIERRFSLFNVLKVGEGSAGASVSCARSGTSGRQQDNEHQHS